MGTRIGLISSALTRIGHALAFALGRKRSNNAGARPEEPRGWAPVEPPASDEQPLRASQKGDQRRSEYIPRVPY
ncbi:MAG TPA: hypothetical protein VN325_05585 [Steroidobacteraceae bacterium]|nr:hypothetical protein [Steroidobacteraceae bacterium]